MNGSILIKVKDIEGTEGINISTETRLKDVGISDKFILVRCLCNAIDLPPELLVVCASAIKAGMLTGSKETCIDMNPIIKAKENMDNEG